MCKLELACRPLTERRRSMRIWNTNECKALLADLEQTPRRVQLHHADLESLIAWCMDEIYELAKSGEDKDAKMQLVGLEYRARLLLKRWKEQNRN